MIPVAIIFDNFGPYHLARLRATASVCDLLSVEVAGKSATYAWTNDSAAGNFRRVTLIEQGISSDVTTEEMGRRLDCVLNPFRPEVVVVPGWASPAAWNAMTWCLQNRVPMICMSESTAWDEPRAAWKEWIKRQLIGLFSAALVGGTHHRDYLATLGMPEARVFLGYDAVDNEYFQNQAEAIRSTSRQKRIDHDLPQDFFLASARFVEKKNLPRLLDAYARYRSLCPTVPWSLVLLGDGELRLELERKVDALGLRGYVQMPGFRQYDELPVFYALAGVFIHPSTIEPWGLVVNEAAASGLPLLVSDRCGCVPELVHKGVNGYSFDPLDVDELARRMVEMSALNFPWADFGRKSVEIVKQWGPGRFASGLSQAIAVATEQGSHRQSIVARGLLGILQRR